ncbi:MAG: hypothetical protein FJ090_19105 [Deltaproteobacteria bacterium]|nr:hypothetical protein [Deltaproteobacteria bacterium]
MLTIASVLVLGLAACPKEEPQKTGIVAQEGGITSETELPEDKDTRKFADHLVRNPITKFKPTDAASGADLIWNVLKFGPKNHFEATAVISAGGETVNCEEAGRWTAEKASSGTEGIINLDTNKSSCPGRSGTDKYRLQITISGDTYQVVMR